MKTITIFSSIQLFLILVLCLFTLTTGKGSNENGMSNERVIIHSLSTQIDKANHEPNGSVLGGTLIYLQAYGHNRTPSKNTIQVGPYPCIIEENGISGDIISCRTTQAYDPERRLGQKVYLSVEGKQPSACEAENNCYFHYRLDYTPVLDIIQPSSSIPNSKVNWYGIWRVDSSADVAKLTIGDYNCNRFELDNSEAPLVLNDNEAMKSQEKQNLPCQISLDMQAGFYNVNSEILYGDFYKKSTTQKLSADGQNQYEIVVTANISGVSSSNGGTNGNRLVISGSGFSNQANNVSVQVGDLQCDIVSVTNNDIVCDLQQGSTDQPSSNSNEKLFTSGTGVQISHWQFDNDDETVSDLEQFVNSVQEGIIDDSMLLFENINGDWEYYVDNEFKNQGVHAKGFFKAPRTGAYKFYMAAGGQANVYLNQTPNDTEFNSENLILEKCLYNPFRSYTYPDDCGHVSDSINLQEGQYYWVDVYVYSDIYQPHFTLSVETPEPQGQQEKWINAQDETQTIKISPNKQNQRFSIKVFGTEEKFSLNFYYRNPVTRKVEFNATTMSQNWVYWSNDDEWFVEHLDLKAGQYEAELISVHELKANGNRCPNNGQCDVQGREWIFDFTLYRDDPKNVVPTCSLPESNCVVEKLQEQSPPVSGSFSLYFLGEPVLIWTQLGQTQNIPYDYYADGIHTGLIQLNDDFINCQVTQQGRAVDGLEYKIHFKSSENKQQWPLIQADGSGLKGGKPGTKPSIDVYRSQSASARPFYEPIPFDMSFIASQTPQIEVWVNSIPSRCSTDCSYETDGSLDVQINNFNLSGNNLNAQLSGVQSGTTLQDIVIYFAGSQCTNLTGSASNVSCTVYEIEAGNNIPRVLVKGQGFASYSGNPEIILPTISQISPDTVGINGKQIVIQGTGFPIQNVENLSVTVGGTDATIVSTSNTEIIAIAPPKSTGNKNVVVNSNGKNSATFSQFTYTDVGVASISDISPTTASPVLKQNIVINGSDFGASVDEIEVWLLNEEGEKTYQLNVLPQNFANNQITARLGGGHVGTYTLAVFNTMGISQNNPTFKYIITIDSVSPQISQDLGGQIVTLTGTNFSKLVSDNNVFLSDGIENLQCYVLSCTQTEIVVRIPPRSANIDNNNIHFVVLGRLVEEATCVGDCSFSYSGVSPTINPITQQYASVGQKLNLTGNGFMAGGEPFLQINGKDYVGTDYVKINNAQSMKITIPLDTPTGQTLILVYLGDSGLAGAVDINVWFYVGKIMPEEPISMGGGDLAILGSGFDEYTYATVNNVPCPVLELYPNYLICLAPVLYEEGDYEVTAGKTGYDPITSNKKAKYRSSATPSQQASTDLTGQKTKSYDLSNYIEEGFAPVEYKIHVTEASSSFSFNLENIQNNQAIEVYLVSIENPLFKLIGQVNNNAITFQNTVAGFYRIVVKYTNLGNAQLAPGSVWEVQFTLPKVSIASGSETGLTGGSTLTLSGAGFQEEDFGKNLVTVCGQICDITSVQFDEIQCTLPQINTQYLDEILTPPTTVLTALFDSEVNLVGKVTTSQSNGQSVAEEWDLDNELNLIDLSDSTNECWVQFESNNGQKIEFQSIVWNMPKDTPSGRDGVEQEDLFYEFIAEGSNDGQNWEKIGDNNPYDKVNFVKSVEQQQANFGFGGFKIDEKSTVYKYIRAREVASEARTNTCKYQSVFLYGRSVYENVVENNADLTCTVKTIVNKKQTSISSGSVNYKGNLTPVVEEVSPAYVSIAGGDQLTINGQNLSNSEVKIDGIECEITTNTSTQIVCTVGRNAENPVNSVLQVQKNGVGAIIQKEVVFYSGLLYSDELNTWSGESVPRDGDTVFVPKGQTLIVDDSNEGVLNTVIVEGTIVFKDGVDIEFNARYIIVRKGKFVIGSEYAPHQSNLRITMHGIKEDKQLPEFGNKVLGCHTCELDIHGTPKTPTWSTLNSTVNVGATSIKLNDGQTNWAVGDEIGIAPTGWSTEENEKRVITNIQHKNSGDVITFEEPLQFKHISVIENYGNTELPMQAEVLNLTRNIKFRGNPDDSITNKYGGHVKVHGSSIDGSVVRISYVEFQYTGQPEIIGRYNVHFHMIGNAIRSYIKGVAAHETFARIVAVHSVHNLLIKDNVGYNNQGHNIFLEDGSETGNVIESNAIISPLSAQNMLQTDITVAGIWVTHPSNYVRYNHVAGSQFYGMWYEIKERVGTHPDVCPMGSIILQVEKNVAHSNIRFGERFFQLKPRKYPCREIRNDKLADPWSENPSVQSIFIGGNYWKNGESGILAEFMGNSIFKDYLLADNYRTGFQAHVTNYTAEHVILQDSLIVGETSSNGGQPEELEHYESSAILVPRTDGFLAKNIDIHNFPEGTNIVESSSENQFIMAWTQGGYQSDFEGISLTNCENAGTIKWQGPLRNVVVDRDGTLTGNTDGQPRWISPYYNYFQQAITDGICIKPENGYQNSVVCTKPIRGLKIGGMNNINDFIGQVLKVFNLQDQNQAQNFGTEDEDYEYFDRLPSMRIKNVPNFDFKDGFTAPLLAGYTYNIHWSQGIDFNAGLFYPSYNIEENDPTTILRFNYTEQREVFDVAKIAGGQTVELFTSGTSKSQFVDENNVPNDGPDGCTYGQYYNDKENSFFYLCINGKQRGENNVQQIGIDAIYCRDTCSNGFECAAGDEQLEKDFQNSNQQTNQAQYQEQPLRRLPGTYEWQTGVPQSGDDILIPCNWIVNFNVEQWEFGTLYIDGTLRISEELESVHIKAINIWIRGGKLVAGNPEEDRQYTKNLTIELVGNEFSQPLVIDDLSQTGTKSLAVTGHLELYGVYPSTTQTRLAISANVGDNTIIVQDDISDWKVGDQIVLGASFIDGTGFEKHTISQINANTKTITLVESIENWHYGHASITVGPQAQAEVNIDEKFGGSLDMRTVVGHITRNIKIIGSNESNIGGHLQIYHYQEGGMDVRGSALLQGVELSNMGQPSSQNAGLHILYTNLPQEGSMYTVIKGSSIHDCNGICLNGNYSNKVHVENNVIYSGEKYLIQALDCKEWKITDNLLIGARLRQGGSDLDENQGIWDPVAIIHMYSNYLPSEDQHEVKGNVASGSQGIGYAFPATPCEEKQLNQFTGNEIGHCAFTGALFNLKQNRCYSVGHISVHSSTQGISINMKQSDYGYQAENIIIAECKENLILHGASDETIIYNNFLSNSWIGAYVRKNCQDCYTADKNQINTRCSGSIGIQLHVTTNTGEHFPFEKDPFQYDVICNETSTFGSCFIDNVEFYNFRQSYNNNGGEQCGENYGFKNHFSASDATAGTYLTDVKCTECEHEALFKLTGELSSWLGWFGGCGDFICTGLENILVQDLTGDYLGHQGTMIGHNENVGDSMNSCDWISSWNAYDCVDNLDFGVLEWHSEGADKQEISPIPVFVENDKFKNKINMWREWEWMGPEPLNERLNRFVSLILINQWTKITYTGTQSVNIMYKLQQRNTIGETDRFVILETNYPTSLALEVSVKGKVIQPFPFTSPGDLNNYSQDCGAHNYFNTNSTIHFVVTNEPNCQVSIKQVNQIYINMRISMTTEEFYSDDANQTDFSSRISSYLEIPTDQVRVVGLSEARRMLQDGTEEANSGSSVLQISILGEEPQAQSEGYDPVAVYETLKVEADKLIEGSLNSELDLGVEVEDAYYELIVLKDVGLEGKTSEDFVDQEWVDKGGDDDDNSLSEEEIGEEEEQSENENDDDDNGSNPNEPKDDDKEEEQGQRVSTQFKVKEDGGGNMVAIALGLIFGIVGVIIISLLGYYFWQKKQIKKISASNLEIPQIQEEKPQVKAAGSSQDMNESIQ